MRTHKILVVGFALVAAAGCAETAPESATERIAAHIYLPEMTSEEIADGAENLVRGTVVRVGEAERVREDVPGATRDFEAVLTPVELRVTETLRGEITPGTTVTLRFLGGTAGGLTYDADGLPTVDGVEDGDTLVVAATRIDTTSEDVVFTPGAVWEVDGQEATALGEFATDDEAPTLTELTGG